MRASDAVAALRPRPSGPPLRGRATLRDGIRKRRLIGRQNTNQGTAGSTLNSPISGLRLGVGVQTYFTNTTAYAGSDNPDGDSYSNADEWVLDSNPWSNTPLFAVTVSNGTLRLSESSINRTYVLFGATNLSTNWSIISTLSGTGTNLSFGQMESLGGESNRFFKAEVRAL